MISTIGQTTAEEQDKRGFAFLTDAEFRPYMNKPKDTMGIVVRAVGDLLSDETKKYLPAITPTVYFPVKLPTDDSEKTLRDFRRASSTAFGRLKATIDLTYGGDGSAE